MEGADVSMVAVVCPRPILNPPRSEWKRQCDLELAQEVIGAGNGDNMAGFLSGIESGIVLDGLPQRKRRGTAAVVVKETIISYTQNRKNDSLAHLNHHLGHGVQCLPFSI